MAHGGKYTLSVCKKSRYSFSHPEFHKREATLMSSRNATRQDFEQVIYCMKERNDSSISLHQSSHRIFKS